ncbi:MAG: cell division protein FtsL [Spirochaetaceae bacterium]|jgi:cell division protein FtsL|nr:cell division protein FtsL [Spirochaetaceae bacterium]
MKKVQLVLALSCAFLAAGLLFLNVWQSFRYNQVVKVVVDLEEEQKNLLELNKRLIAGAAVLSSPGRIDEIARDELGLVKTEPSGIIQIELPGGTQ